MKEKRKRSKKIQQSNNRRANIDLRLRGQNHTGLIYKEIGKYEEPIRPARKMQLQSYMYHSETNQKEN